MILKILEGIIFRKIFKKLYADFGKMLWNCEKMKTSGSLD